MIKEVEKLKDGNIYLEMSKLERIGKQAFRQAIDENRQFGLDEKLNRVQLFLSKSDHLVLVCNKHKVRQLSAFGSILTNRFSPSSDVDFLVKFEEVDPMEYADNYYDLKYELEKLLQREVDLLEEQAIRNLHLKQQIDATKKLVYERRS